MREILKELSWNLGNISKLCLFLAENQKNIPTNDKTPTNNNTTSEKNEITIEEVREVLAQKSKNGRTEEIKTLLMKFGANKLSQVKSEDFAQIIIEAEKL